MKAIPYVSFNGNCEEAIRFYHSVIGGNWRYSGTRTFPTEAVCRPRRPGKGR